MSAKPPVRPPSEDAPLIARATGADRRAARAALSELFLRHRPRVRAVAFRLTRSDADADDVVQDTFIAVLEKLDTFRGESAFGSWVYRVAANFALMRLRAAAARRNQPLDETNEPASLAARVDDLCDARRRLDDVARAAARLKRPASEVIALRAVEGLDTAQVAAKLGVSEDVIKVRLHRARASLCDLLPWAA
ncbi:MAG: sigma-70 family RNA polymerase sigma factor [Myxococcales bacterium]|nr:sigma-70 family RNA polymerase sigma factor [Myxococcales bacterium]